MGLHNYRNKHDLPHCNSVKETQAEKGREQVLCADEHKGINKLNNLIFVVFSSWDLTRHAPSFLVSLHTQRPVPPYVWLLMQHIDSVSVLEAPVTSLPQPLLSLNPPQQLLSIQIKGWRKSARRHFALEYEIYSPLGVEPWVPALIPPQPNNNNSRSAQPRQKESHFTAGS